MSFKSFLSGPAFHRGPKARLLTIDDAKGSRTFSIKELSELLLTRPIVRGGKGGPRPGSPTLCAVEKGGGQLKLHEFGSSGDGEAVAKKVGEYFAEAAGLPLRVAL